MLPKLTAFGTLLIALLAIFGSYSQISALNLSQQRQRYYWPRRGTVLSGRRYRDRWVPVPGRTVYGEFRGGGIGSGK
ncbi:MAG: hypothetical protein AAFY57_07220 [Cyanobacteria bacterium J06642_2]